MKSIFIKVEVLNSIHKTLCTYSAECGGIFACDEKGNIVDYYFDKTAGVGNISYCPTCNVINDVVNKHWYPKKICFGGIAHSHPFDAQLYPSKEDIRTASLILAANHLDRLVLIIVQEKVIKAWEIQEGHAIEECLLVCT